jgi:hypothetical protein
MQWWSAGPKKHILATVLLLLLPGIGTGLRGAVAFEVEVSTAGMDLHSGLKGGSVQNANHALVTLLASLKDADNRCV